MSDFYISPIKPDEIYHYGMPGRSGRYKWGSGDRPYQRLEKKVVRSEKRLNKKLDRADKKTEKLSKESQKYFNKANQRSNSAFRFRRRSSRKFLNKGYEVQEKKERVEYRTSKKYMKYLKKFEKRNVTMTPALKKRGIDYYNRMISNTNNRYNALLNKRI